jgi:hypothetical protein
MENKIRVKANKKNGQIIIRSSIVPIEYLLVILQSIFDKDLTGRGHLDRLYFSKI